MRLLLFSYGKFLIYTKNYSFPNFCEPQKVHHTCIYDNMLHMLGALCMQIVVTCFQMILLNTRISSKGFQIIDNVVWSKRYISCMNDVVIPYKGNAISCRDSLHVYTKTCIIDLIDPLPHYKKSFRRFNWISAHVTIMKFRQPRFECKFALN